MTFVTQSCLSLPPTPSPALDSFITILNSSPLGAAYIRQLIGSAKIQIMACCLFGAKPSSKPMLDYCQLDPWEQTSVKFFIKIQKFSFIKMHLKTSSAKWRPFCPGGEVNGCQLCISLEVPFYKGGIFLPCSRYLANVFVTMSRNQTFSF